jgi:diguanylate cyclase
MTTMTNITDKVWPHAGEWPVALALAGMLPVVMSLGLWLAGLWRVEVHHFDRVLQLNFDVLAVPAMAMAGAGLLILTAAFAGYAGSRVVNAPLEAPESSSTAIQSKLETSMDAVCAMFEAAGIANDRYGAELAKINVRVQSSTKPAQVLEAIRSLVQENERMQSEVNDLKGALDNAHSQVKELRVELKGTKEETFLDDLTKLRNRRWFDANLSKEIETAKTKGLPLCLALLDIDHFKSINDRFGHTSGDIILTWFGQVLRANVKGRDTPARYGGEEFALVLPHTKLEGAKHLTEQIRKELERRPWVHRLTGRPIGIVTASFGVAQLRDGETADVLIERADANLYAAKHSGRNCVVGTT